MSSTTPGPDPERPHDPDAVDGEPAADAEAAATDTGADEPPAAEPPAAEPEPAASEPPAAEPEPPVEEHPADETPEAEPEPESSEAESTSVEPEPVAAEPVAAQPVAPEPVAPEPAPDDTARLDEAVQRATAAPVAADEVGEHGAPEPVPAQSVRRETYVPAATVAAGTAAGAATLAPEPAPAPAPQTVYVQAPTPPRRRGNRGFGVLVALVAAVVFALLYAGIAYLLLLGQTDASQAASVFNQFLLRPVFWLPVLATFVGFALLAVIVNRGAWWYYAVFGLLVGVLVYLSYLGAALLTIEAWTLTVDEVNEFIGQRWLDPFALIAGILAREITIWLGAWVAARGRTVTERNRIAREAYDRELAAGPQPVHP